MSDPELSVADAIGRLMEFWGFKRPMGRIWTLLYLSPEPLAAAEIAERLSMSPSAAALTLSELSEWGVVKKTGRPGERRHLFVAETSIFKLVSRVLRERELVLVRDVASSIESAERAIASQKKSQAAGFKRERLGRLLALARMGEGLIAALASGTPVDPLPVLRAASEGDGRPCS